MSPHLRQPGPSQGPGPGPSQIRARSRGKCHGAVWEVAGATRIGEEEGMQDFTMSLKGLIDDELIDRPTAFAVAPNKDALKMALKGIDVKAPGIL